MRTVKPIEPISAVRGIRRITLRRVPSIKQLRMWLAFARQKAKDGPARTPASGQAAVDPLDPPADLEDETETGPAADHGHIDKRA
jgi:hypothetical protein